MRFFVVALFASLLMPSIADAQTSRYSSWSDPSKPSTTADQSDMKGLLERLNKMIDEAEKAKAADPVFLRDLRALANGYTRPWNTVVLNETFADGNFDTNPTWQVLSGEYFIEQGWGLRNKLIEPAQAQKSTSSGDDGKDLALAILGQVLNQAAGGSASQPKTSPQTTENVIATSVRVSNAFAIEAEISSWVQNGRMELGVFQGNDARIGYRLVYESGGKLGLVRIGSRGQSVVQTSAEPINLEDKKFHLVEWTRNSDGQMIVKIDGKDVLQVTDKSFSDPFDGIRISDTGGDFIVKRVNVTGI